MKLTGDQARLLKAALSVAIQTYKPDHIREMSAARALAPIADSELARDIIEQLMPQISAVTAKNKPPLSFGKPFVDTGICTGILFGLIMAEQYGVPDWVKECIKK